MAEITSISIPYNKFTWLLFLILLIFGVSLRTFPTAAQPYVYIANPSDDTVSVIDSSTRIVVDTIDVGDE